jgi:glutamate 5-kinase
MKTIQKIIVKVGTSTLTQGNVKLSRRWMLGLVEQFAHLHDAGKQLVLVSSGAVAAGRELLGIASSEKQLCAGAGQVILMQTWLELFSLFELNVGQVLLTKEDLIDDKK